MSANHLNIRLQHRGVLIPQNDVPKRIGEIDRNREIGCSVQVGWTQSANCEYLKQSGFPTCPISPGGIVAWSDEVDPKVPKYLTDALQNGRHPIAKAGIICSGFD